MKDRGQEQVGSEALAWRTSTWFRKALFIVPVAIGLGFYVVHLRSDLYGDEGVTFRVISEGNFLNNLWSPDLCHPPVYFIAARFCYSIVGLPWAIRLPSLIATLGVVVLIARMTYRYFGQRVALWTVWLAALSPILIEFAAEGRPYAMLAFFSTALTYFSLRFLENENWKTMFALSAALIGGLLTHYIFSIYVVFSALYYLAKRRYLTKYALGMISLVTPVVVLLVIGVFRNVGHSARVAEGFNMNFNNLVNFVARLPVAIGFGFCTFRLPHMDLAKNVTIEMIRHNIILVMIMVGAFMGLGWCTLRALLRRKHYVGFLLCSIAVPVALGLAGIVAGAFIGKEKYLIGIVGPYLILVASAFGNVQRSWVARGTAAAYLFLILVSILHYTVYPNEYSRRADWMGLRRFLHAHVDKGDTVLFYRVERESSMDVRPNVKGVRLVDIKGEKPEQLSVGEFTEEIEESCQGCIYLVNREVDRYWLDPRSEAIHTLKKRRSFDERRFGRPLSVYIFHQKQKNVPITCKPDEETGTKSQPIRLPRRAGHGAWCYTVVIW
jgi:hypothetical protein